MSKNNTWRWSYLVAPSLFLAASLLALSSGSFALSFSEILQLLFLRRGSEQAQLILLTFRVPRMLLAALVGGALGVAGHILQTITRNPIADAGLLGVSAGASFGSVFFYFLAGTYFSEATQLQSISLVTFGFIGAVLALFLNFFLSYYRSGINMQRFLLNGIGISSGFAALTTFFSLKINADDYAQVNNWLEGSVRQGNWTLVQQVAPWVLIALAGTFLLAPKLELLRFSDVQLQTIGFSLNRWRALFIFFAAVLVCSSVLVAGNVSFVGLLVPHFTKRIVSQKSRLFIPCVFANGMSMVILCDVFAKTAFAPNELPLNAVMGLLGVPYLAFLFLQNAKQERN